MAEKKIKNSAVHDARLKADIASFKSSVAFLLFCAVIFFTATNLQYTRTSLYMPLWMFINSHKWIMLIPVILFGLSAFWRFRALKSKKEEGYSYFSSSDAFTITLFVLAFLVAFTMTYSVALLIVLTIAFALCYYSTRLFSRDFMLTTFMNSAFAMLIWLIGGKSFTTGTLPLIAKTSYLSLSLLTVLAVIFAVIMIFTGKIKVNAKGSYIPVIASFVIGAVLCGVLAFAPGLISMIVAEIILLAQYVALGVYYTVRLLNQ